MTAYFISDIRTWSAHSLGENGVSSSRLFDAILTYTKVEVSSEKLRKIM
jgi:hypothetical protein